MRVVDLSDPEPKWSSITVDGKETTEWFHQGGSRTTVFENGNTLTVSNMYPGPISLYDWNNGAPKLVTEKFPVSGFPVFVPQTNQMIYVSDGFVRFRDLSGAEPKELSPFDAATAIPCLGNTAFDSERARLLLLRYDFEPGKWNRLQLWDLTGKRPGPSPNASTFLIPEGQWYFHCFAGANRWLQITHMHQQRSRLYILADGPP